MGFFEAIETCLKKYAVFQGRARRSEYWWFVLFYTIIIIGLDTVTIPDQLQRMAELRATGVLPPADGFHSTLRIVQALVELAFFLPSLAVQVRRLHDTNRSGWWLLGLLGVPIFLSFLAGLTSVLVGRAVAALLLALVGLGLFVAAIILLIWFCTRGTDGPNRFGPDPIRAF